VADVCKTCGQRHRRSLPQNKRLHALFTELAANVKGADDLYHPAAWWKVMSKDRWLGYDEYRKPDGGLITVMRSTADLDVAELTAFMDEVERYAAKRGVYLVDDVAALA
jgi:hypothetical protein